MRRTLVAAMLITACAACGAGPARAAGPAPATFGVSWDGPTHDPAGHRRRLPRHAGRIGRPRGLHWRPRGRPGSVVLAGQPRSRAADHRGRRQCELQRGRLVPGRRGVAGDRWRERRRRLQRSAGRRCEQRCHLSLGHDAVRFLPRHAPRRHDAGRCARAGVLHEPPLQRPRPHGRGRHSRAVGRRRAGARVRRLAVEGRRTRGWCASRTSMRADRSRPAARAPTTTTTTSSSR